jgi:hypothetical protein
MYGADPLQKDVFVEVDWMGGDCTLGIFCHDHKPDPNAIQDVVTAFDNAPVGGSGNVKRGINLHVQVDEEIPHESFMNMSMDGNGYVDFTLFDEKKQQYFGTAQEKVIPNATSTKLRSLFHYALFAHKITKAGNSGVGELSGNDFVVALGTFTNERGTRSQQAGTFMHELGHNLGLGHGGDSDINCKPNYLSVMSYSRQFEDLLPNRPLDYSREKLPSLYEDNLDESTGISSLDATVFGPSSIKPRVSQGVSAIDWSDGDEHQDGITGNDTGVKADINKISSWISGCDGSNEHGTELQGFDDWNNLVFNVRNSSDYTDGVHLTQTPEEMSTETYEQIQIVGRLINGIDVDVDIKPVSTDNVFNLKSKGVIPVAVLSSEHFDATKIDPQTVRFGKNGIEAAEVHKIIHIEDVNNDGISDVVLHFNVVDTQLDSSATYGWLTGATLDGEPLKGNAAVSVK